MIANGWTFAEAKRDVNSASTFHNEALLAALKEMDERCREYLDLEAKLKAQQQQPSIEGHTVVTIQNESEDARLLLPAAPTPRRPTINQFRALADVPPADAWFAKIRDPRTRRAYQADVEDFMRFAGLEDPRAFRDVGRAHILAWRRDLEKRALSGATVRRKLSTLSSLFEALCKANAVQGNPVDGVERPKITRYERTTPVLSAHQARALLEAPDASTLQGLRDHAILATLLYTGLRCPELCALRVVDLQEYRGAPLLHVRTTKRSAIRHIPLHQAVAGAIAAYLEADGRSDDKTGALFRPVSNNAKGDRAITPDGVNRMLAKYAGKAGIDAAGFGAHSLRATAAINAFHNGADIAQVQTFLGHTNIATTHRYYLRQEQADDSPTFKVDY